MEKISQIMLLIIFSLSISSALILSSQVTANAAKPDLIISHFSAPDSARAGQDIHGAFRLIVKNRGTATAKNFSIDLVLSKDQNVPVHLATYSANFKDDVLLRGGRSHIDELRPGQSADVSDKLSGTIPSDTPSGSYWLGIVVDSAGKVDEAKENNNTSVRRIRITGKKPELELSDTESPKAYIEVEGILVFTVGDKIKIRASAEDNVKVAKIYVYVDGRLVKTCKAWQCWYSQALTQAGPHKCWSVAEDTSGNRAQSKTLEFMVHPTAKPGPALTTKIQPYHPTSQDKIRFTAEARHSSGVESVTIFVNNRTVKTCSRDRCEYVGGPYNAGKIVWRVSAKSRDGGVTYGYDKMIEIASLETGTCSITGKVYGSGVGSAQVFFVALYGPNDFTLHRETKHFDQTGRYSFIGLPNGRYKLVVDTRADIFIGPHPSSRIVECRGGAITNKDFELR